MSKPVMRIAALMMILCLFLSSASADAYPLKRGSRGDEVLALQQMLFDLGFLSEEPDGIFGGKTEAAVKAWQKYRGSRQTGRMTEEAMTVLDDTWVHVEGIASEANATTAELKQWVSGYCYPFEEGHTLCYEYCYRHYRQVGLSALLTQSGMPAKMELKVAERLRDLWLRDIRAMYASWEKSAAKSRKKTVREQLNTFESALKEKQAEWQKGITAKRPNYAVVQEALWLNEIGVGLCFDLNGAEKN